MIYFVNFGNNGFNGQISITQNKCHLKIKTTVGLNVPGLGEAHTVCGGC